MSQKVYTILNPHNYKEKFSFATEGISPFDIGIPLIDISDKTIEEIYYFRWHSYCSHIKDTVDGYVITEFLPPVHWAGAHNTISCAAGHHFYEGRWLHQSKFINSYANFWFSPHADPRKYSCWIADGIVAAAKVSGDFSTAKALYQPLKENYRMWEREKGTDNGMFYQDDNLDGMEYSAGGSGWRPTLNCYMYGDAIAISTIARLLGEQKQQKIYADKAQKLKANINSVLWDERAKFFKTFDIQNGLVPVRELIGYIPWYFNIPSDDKSDAWQYLMDKNYFSAPYGPTTTEQNAPQFMESFDHECLWNGPSWPYATSQTLTALGNLLSNYTQKEMTKSDYFALLHQYAACHYLTEGGQTIPFIDENLDPFTGQWLARKILRSKMPHHPYANRGELYNHSTFCDLVLSGLAGICSSVDTLLSVNPLFCEDDLDYFCADGIVYHSHSLCVVWDKDGQQYGKGRGFSVFCDGERVFFADKPDKTVLDLEKLPSSNH